MVSSIEIQGTPINKKLVQKRFAGAASSYRKHAVVQKDMARICVEMAEQYIELPQCRMFEIGCGTGLLTEMVIEHFAVKDYICNDLVSEVFDDIKELSNTECTNGIRFIPGDAEQIFFPKQQDVIWSGATLQWIQNREGFFDKVANSLTNGGFAVISSFGPENFREVKHITGHGIDYPIVEQVKLETLQNFEVLAINEWRQTLWSKTALDVLKHMRYTGVNGITPCQWTKKDVLHFQHEYDLLAQANGYPLTYHPFVMVLRKRVV